MTSDATLSPDTISESIPSLDDAPAAVESDGATDLTSEPAADVDADATDGSDALDRSDESDQSDDDELLSPQLRFTDLDLPEPLLRAVVDLEFVTPSPIQAAAIPALLAGRDITGVAQTGTGKTAAFGLPLLAAIQPRQRQVQALVLTPTRELAMQVAEALTTFAKHLPSVDVVAVYGGAPFPPQRDALRKGAQIVVGTPGRVIDHLERHTLDLSGLVYLVLDEADEMLRMGFAEDVDRILSDAPSDRQTALFSATMPPAIRSIAASHLTNPVDIAVARQSSTVENVTQTYAVVPFRQKVDVLARILQMNEGTAAAAAGADGEDQKPATIVFVRTKQACDEVGTELVARGVTAAALNGDVPQKERERIIERLRDGRLDVLVATDVAARGLDVERIDLVVNFDAPLEPESYVHRIGRTGRAGRTGQALTFFTPREVGRLRAIERATRQKITQVTPPTAAEVASHRLGSMLRRAVERSDAGLLSNTRRTVADFLATGQATAEELAVALLALSIGDEGRPMAEPEVEHTFDERTRSDRPTRGDRPGGRGDRSVSDRGSAERGGRRREGPIGPRYRLAVGHRDGVRPAGIVGALTGESDLRGSDLGKIDIYDTFSLVEINEPLSDAALSRLGAAKVSGRALRIQPDTGGSRRTGGAAHAPGQHGPRTPRRFGKERRGERRD
ncbi:DEAD/DEAH box helicase [Nakamurella flava]|uniref:RNA helicase n=1 Tax=Nakamurella flava TaxID=2576308 RepID=A0A4U6QJV9_9ACTN|nr:DEAD/DEAH box helicase [Nakamurella flava]TKV60376.1 DEAD/DEAH box helicase [Nakamurella flava]